MSVAILGAGRIGSYIASQLAENTQNDIHLLARGNYEAIKESGITVTDDETGETLTTKRFTLYRDVRDLPPCDLVIITVHVHQNRELLTQDLPLFRPHTRVVSLQNGLDFEQGLAEMLPSHTPLYSGTCWIKISQIGPAHIRHHFGKNIKLGPPETKIKDFFTQAGFSLDLTDDVKSVQLTKMALNIPFIALMAKYGKSTTEILADPELNAQRQALQNELAEVSFAIGSPLDLDLISRVVEDLKKTPNIPPASREKLAEAMKYELKQHIPPLIRILHVPLLKSMLLKIE